MSQPLVLHLWCPVYQSNKRARSGDLSESVALNGIKLPLAVEPSGALSGTTCMRLGTHKNLGVGGLCHSARFNFTLTLPLKHCQKRLFLTAR
jgi:hypothetical protein